MIATENKNHLSNFCCSEIEKKFFSRKHKLHFTSLQACKYLLRITNTCAYKKCVHALACTHTHNSLEIQNLKTILLFPSAHVKCGFGRANCRANIRFSAFGRPAIFGCRDNELSYSRLQQREARKFQFSTYVSSNRPCSRSFIPSSFARPWHCKFDLVFLCALVTRSFVHVTAKGVRARDGYKSSR